MHPRSSRPDGDGPSAQRGNHRAAAWAAHTPAGLLTSMGRAVAPPGARRGSAPRPRAGLRTLALLLLLALTAAACAGTTRHAAARSTTSGPPSTPSPAGVADQTTSPSAAGCPDGQLGLHQTMSGRIHACLRVGALAAGAYHVRLDGVVSSSSPVTPARSSATPPVISLSLSPASGSPGATITVTGKLAAAVQRSSQMIEVCFDGCQDGLRYSGVPATWSSDQVFRASIVVPAGPWVERDPTRVVVPSTGTIPIGVQCISLTDEAGCGLRGALASTPFSLVVHRSSPCSSSTNCAQLTVTPVVVRPGDVLRISGFAPITSVIGSDQPFAGQLHVAPGTGSGPEVRFRKKTSALAMSIVFARFGHARFTVQAPPSFASLATGKALGPPIDDALSPLWGTPGTSTGSPTTAAWCEPGAIHVAGPSATGSQAIPTTAAVAELTAAGLPPYPPVSQDRAACVGLALEVGHPRFALAVFNVNPHGTAPPLALVAMETTDAGSNWAPIPVPQGAAETTFAGLRTTGSGIEALFTPTRGSGTDQPSVLAEVNTDGGQRWHPARLSCPAAGPCVTFGPYQPGNCAMNGSIQSVLRSGNSGSSWTDVTWPSAVQSCDPAELLPTGPRSMLLAAAGSPYLLFRTTDSGRTWGTIGLPSLPGHTPGSSFLPDQGGLFVLPDGWLLAWSTHDGAPPTTSWYLLPARSSTWCPAAPSLPSRGAVRGTPRVIGTQLWWGVTPPSNQAASDGAIVVHQVKIADLHC